MRTIEISVNDKDLSRLKTLLLKLDFIKGFKEKHEANLDALTLVSEESLAEEWNSKEDSRYEQFFQK
jgi:hypothetical protein